MPMRTAKSSELLPYFPLSPLNVLSFRVNRAVVRALKAIW